MRDTHAQRPRCDRGLPIVSPADLATLSVELNCMRRKRTENPQRELERDGYPIRVHLLKRSEHRIGGSGACGHIVPCLAAERQKRWHSLGTDVYHSGL